MLTENKGPVKLSRLQGPLILFDKAFQDAQDRTLVKSA